MDAELQTVDIGGAAIAVRHRPAGSDVIAPGFLWLGGFRSDMDGSKAVELDRWCATRGHACTRLDYSGHGLSGGAFRDGTISRWAGEARSVLERFCGPRTILVGSSMGAWIALLLAKALNKGAPADPVAAMLLLAPAPDFTSELMEPDLTEAQRHDLAAKGYIEEETPYGPDPNIFTRALFEDGLANRVMTGPIDTFCPVHIIQGQADPDVPWQHAQKLFSLLPADDATIAYVRDGDHRLSRPEDIAMMLRAAATLHRIVS